MYIEINGVRLSQDALLAISEAVIAHAFIAALFLTVHIPCVRPQMRWNTRRWLRPWKTYLTLYSVLALVCEVLWVQLGALFRVDTEENAFACPWTQDHLAVWTLSQLALLVAILSTWSYARRKPVLAVMRGVCGTHAMVMMALAMAGMYENGACGAMVFPMLTALLGMMMTCCCMPWHLGAWTMHPDDGEVLIYNSEEEKDEYTWLGWFCIKRQRRRLRRATTQDTRPSSRRYRANGKSDDALIGLPLSGDGGGSSSSSSSDKSEIDSDDEHEDEQGCIMQEVSDGEAKALHIMNNYQDDADDADDQSQLLKTSGASADKPPFVSDPKTWSKSRNDDDDDDEDGEHGVEALLLTRGGDKADNKV